MRVQCALCDRIETIDNNSLKAKRLKNNYIQMHLCKECHERISHKTIKRHQTGKFRLYGEKKQKERLL